MGQPCFPNLARCLKFTSYWLPVSWKWGWLKKKKANFAIQTSQSSRLWCIQKGQDAFFLTAVRKTDWDNNIKQKLCY